uniref:FAS1 domain-containing protein n=1 Tax=Oryza punctata TaxID=4537 RepID=A0A0E0LAH6_ORYPU
MALSGILNASTVFLLLLLLRVSPFTPALANMYKTGCLSFDSLVISDDAAEEMYQRSWKGSGLTVFCPADDAVAAFVPTFRNLTADAKLALLLYHAVATHYYSEKELKTINGEVTTLAIYGGKSLNLTVEDDAGGATVKLSSSSAGNVARVTKTIQDMDPHAVYLIDAVLLPREGLDVSPGAGAPSPAPIASPAPALATNPSRSPDRQPAPTPAPVSAPAATPDADNQPAADQSPENSARSGMASWSLLSVSVAVPAIAWLVLW